MSLVVEVPDEVASALRVPEQERASRVLLELACGLYANGLLPAGKAAQLSGLPRLRFGEEIARRGIPRHYGEGDLAKDIAHAGL